MSTVVHHRRSTGAAARNANNMDSGGSDHHHHHHHTGAEQQEQQQQQQQLEHSRSQRDASKSRRRRKRSTTLSKTTSQVLHHPTVQQWLPLVLVLVVMALTFAVVYTGLQLLSNWLLGGRRKAHALPNHGIQGRDYDILQDLDELEWNPIYRVPESMSVVGDRSDEYVTLRQETDALLDDAASRRKWFAVAEEAAAAASGAGDVLQYQPRSMETHNSDQLVPYDIYDCPATPPAGYPYAWKTVDILQAWPAEDTQPPTNEDNEGLVHQSLCVFDYTTDYEKAVAYRDASLPFVVVNDPAVQATVARWAMPGYVDRLMGDVLHRTEYSENTHFMYYVPPPKRGLRNKRHGDGPPPPRNHNGARKLFGGAQKDQVFGGRGKRFGVNPPAGWTAPTKMTRMTYSEWLSHANVTDEHTGPGQPHWYFRLIGCGTTANDGSCDQGSSEYLYDELPFFQPKPSLYIVEPGEQKGIHCRFGMKGVIAENHFDSSRNAIVVLGGSRRYILSHPDQCDNLVLYPKGHPSARHSAVNWANPDLEEYPAFANARSNEVVLQPGHVLYLPTNWFHFIVSQGLNMQCNSRSGIEKPMMDYVHACGF